LSKKKEVIRTDRKKEAEYEEFTLLSEPEANDLCERYISNYNLQSTKLMLDSLDTVNRLKEEVHNAVKKTDAGFDNASRMYLVTFIFGILLIIAAFISAIFNSNIPTVLFGSAGTVQLVAFFFKNPPLMLQQNRAQLAKLKAAYYGWFLNTENWVQLIYDLSVRGDKAKLKVDQMKTISDGIADSTQKFMSVFPTEYPPEDKQTQGSQANGATKKDNGQADGKGMKDKKDQSSENIT